MDSHIDSLSRKALDLLDASGDNTRVLIGVAGVPGSGKTTIAAAVSSRINELFLAGQPKNAQSQRHLLAVAVPMDGFHYSRAHLSSMANPEEATHRRGAAFTFDGEGFLDLIQRLRAPAVETVYAPSFGHENKDPVPDSIPIYPESRVVLVEGNYCALNRAPWKDAAALLDKLWYVDTPADIAHARLAARHLASGIVADEKEAWERATGTDELNAQDIRANLLKVDEIVHTT